ncbi:MAG TPA: preprotein translocase subunit SecG [Limnochordia bacterium]|nr:preprotein translocase subunit SecG [Limnochordia bacterium]
MVVAGHILLLLISLALIVAVLLQKSKGEGLGAIGGSAQMFFDQPKGVDKALDRATAILAGAFMLLAILLAL